MSEPTAKRLKSTHEAGSDQEYFESYGHLQCHKAMLSDFERTNAYRTAIFRSYLHFYKKSVMDVGCGTGILSLFCAQAGAAKVYAIEASEIAQVADKVIKGNFLSHVIDLHKKPLEQIELLHKVDVIVSEWMGYTLMTEWMIKSVLRARDKWLKPGGLMFPCRAEVFIAAMAEEENSDWEEMSDRYKVDLSCCAAVESAGRIGKMVVREVDDAELISRPTQIFQLDLALVKIEEVESLCKGQFQLGSIGDCKVAGFCVFFDVEFPGGVKLSTSPQADLTHWCQTVLAVEPFAVHQDELISGELRFEQNSSNKRLLTVHLRVENSQKNYKFDHYSEEV